MGWLLGEFLRGSLARFLPLRERLAGPHAACHVTWLSPDATLTPIWAINWSTKECLRLPAGVLLEHSTAKSDWAANGGDVALLAIFTGPNYWVIGSPGMTTNVADDRNALRRIFPGSAKRRIGVQLLRSHNQWIEKEGVDLAFLYGAPHRKCKCV